MSVSFGVLLLQNRPVSELLDWARRFDEAGADSVWVADHLANPHALDHQWYEGWDLLSAMAGVTKQCRIGPLVTTFLLHSPLAMARHVVTVDALSAGRLDLGVGSGGAPVDRAAQNIEDASMGELGDRLDHGLATLLALLDGEEISLPVVAEIADRPVPKTLSLATPSFQERRIPIVIGGQGHRTLDAAAKYADRWNVYRLGVGGGDARDEFRRDDESFVDRCQAIGRDPNAVVRSVLLDLSPVSSASGRAELTEVVGRLSSWGFQEFIAYAWKSETFLRPPEDLLSFVAEDLPALRWQLA